MPKPVSYPTKHRIGNQLGMLMDAKSITNKALAEEMEVSPETISRIVNASSAPGLDLLEKLADYFEVSIDSFFARSKHYC